MSKKKSSVLKVTEIEVNYNHQKKVYVVPNKSLQLTNLQQYFPNAAGLSYQRNNKSYLVNINEGQLQLPSGITDYEVVFSEGLHCESNSFKLADIKRFISDAIVEKCRLINEAPKQETYDTERNNIQLKDLSLYKIPMVTMIPDTSNDLKFTDIELGRGTYGVVKKGFYLETPVAIKSLHTADAKLIKREINILARVRHENIISIIAASLTSCHFHIIMTYFDSESLYNILFGNRNENYKNQYILDIDIKNRITLQVCRAIYYLHIYKIIHCDIKPANILVNKEYNVRVCDFGLSKIYAGVTDSAPLGSPLYMAPELLLENKAATIFSDNWSLACSPVELYSESRVWKLNNGEKDEIKRKLKNKEIPDLFSIPEELIDEIQLSFSYDPFQRPQADKIINKFTMSENMKFLEYSIL